MKGLSRKPFRSSKGFTIVEVVIVAAIMGIVGLAMSQLMGGMLKLQKQLDVKATRTRLLKEYSHLASNPLSELKTLLVTDYQGNKDFKEFKNSNGVTKPSGMQEATRDPATGKHNNERPIRIMNSRNEVAISEHGEYLTSQGVLCKDSNGNKYTNEDQAKANPKCFFIVIASWFYQGGLAETQVELRPIQGRSSRYGYLASKVQRSLSSDRELPPPTITELVKNLNCREGQVLVASEGAIICKCPLGSELKSNSNGQERSCAKVAKDPEEPSPSDINSSCKGGEWRFLKGLPRCFCPSGSEFTANGKNCKQKICPDSNRPIDLGSTARYLGKRCLSSSEFRAYNLEKQRLACLKKTGFVWQNNRCVDPNRARTKCTAKNNNYGESWSFDESSATCTQTCGGSSSADKCGVTSCSMNLGFLCPGFFVGTYTYSYKYFHIFGNSRGCPLSHPHQERIKGSTRINCYMLNSNYPSLPLSTCNSCLSNRCTSRRGASIHVGSYREWSSYRTICR